MNGLTKNIKIVICLFFHPIRYFMVRFVCFKLKSAFFLENLVLCLTHLLLGIWPKKIVLKPVELFSGHCLALKH